MNWQNNGALAGPCLCISQKKYRNNPFSCRRSCERVPTRATAEGAAVGGVCLKVDSGLKLHQEISSAWIFHACFPGEHTWGGRLFLGCVCLFGSCRCWPFSYVFKGKPSSIRLTPLSFHKKARLYSAHYYTMSIDFGPQSWTDKMV